MSLASLPVTPLGSSAASLPLSPVGGQMGGSYPEGKKDGGLLRRAAAASLGPAGPGWACAQPLPPKPLHVRAPL